MNADISRYVQKVNTYIKRDGYSSDVQERAVTIIGNRYINDNGDMVKRYRIKYDL
jgi:hypothetical protein